ncbi:pyridoxal phosphate-dependent aminotransferase, partial [Candidatus Woesearchaeota archaeon]|nr:pyridoxal phosphate-dependent aminotransferase [Candidatus Woesearchaeota archaeon]
MAGQDISEKALMIKPSATFAVQQKVKELNARGRQVIGFGLGEPDFPVPQAIKDSIAQALADRKTKYVPIAGIPELRQAIADKLKADNNLDYSPEQVIVSTGAKQALFNAMSALLNPGDEVLIPVPYWTSYPEMVAFCDGKPVFVPTRDFMPDTDSVEKAITRRTKLLIINSPNNPSGAVISKKNMKALAELAADKGLWVISDEIYEKIIYEGSHVSFGSLDRRAFEKTITINGFSKSYAMTGLRLGYAAGPKKVIQAMANIQGQVTSNATSIVQYGALSAFSQ